MRVGNCGSWSVGLSERDCVRAVCTARRHPVKMPRPIPPTPSCSKRLRGRSNRGTAPARAPASTLPEASSSPRSDEPDQSTAEISEDALDSSYDSPKPDASSQAGSDHAPSDSESDEAPEVISKGAGKRQVKEREDEIEKFTRATAQARRKANRLRDEKLKRNSEARKTKVTIDEPTTEELPSSDDDEHEQEHESIKPTPPVISNTMKYLDPSLFATASDIIKQSKEASRAREMNESKALTSRRKRRKKMTSQDWKDIGNNTTVVALSQTDHLSPASRPVAAANFARNRLYTKPNRSAIRLSKTTIAAKKELGIRCSDIGTISRRRAHKPAVIFARPSS